MRYNNKINEKSYKFKYALSNNVIFIKFDYVNLNLYDKRDLFFNISKLFESSSRTFKYNIIFIMISSLRE